MPNDSLEGQNLDKYRVLEPLGRGGMARVYRAYHPQLDRYVAIKVLRSDLVDEEEFPARFTREARAVARLRHPNIVQVFDFDVRGDVYYMVMELLPGDTLRRRLDDYRARKERMPLGEVVRILLDILDGLGYAHDEGMIHRDVKPANILLTRRGEAVLSDFGIAQIIGGTRHTVSGALMGTLSYMAPEQGLEGQCDARSDLYSLGIVFYEMLAGEPPFDAETPLAILMKHVNDPLPLPRQRCPDLPPALERVVLKVLAKRPGDRYQTAAQMSAALQQAAQEAGIELPARLSLPMSFTTPAAPAEPVAVLSGEDRDRVLDAEFAAEDTDARLGQWLAKESAAQAKAAAEPAAARPAAGEEARPGPAGQAVRLGIEIVGQPAARAAGSPPGAGRALVRAVALLFAGNLAAVFLAALTGRWGLYERGWPFELLLVGVGLALLAEARGVNWYLIPMGIVLGNGYLMTFYAITGFWPLWRFFWPLEPALVGGLIWLAVVLGERGDRGQAVVRRLARLVQRPTLLLVPVVILLGVLFG